MVYKDQKSLQDVWKKIIVPKKDIVNPSPPKYWPLPDNISTFLDAGCGGGSYVVFANNQGMKAIGIDIVSEAMKIAQMSCNGDFVVGDVRALPFKDGYFDYILSYGVVEHFKETDKALSEIYRVLKSDGTAVISVPGLITLHWVTKLLSKTVGKWDCGYEKAFTPKGFRRLLENENFVVVEMKIIETGDADFPNYPIVAIFISFFDRAFIRIELGGRFIFAKCRKNVERNKIK